MITAIGNPVFDTIQTHSIRTDGRVLSGCSTNFCLALSRLGVKTTLAGNIGPDFRERIEREMSEYGIDYTLFDAGESGGFHLRYYGGHGERELTLLGDAGPITEVPDSVRESDFVVFGPILSEVDKRYMELVR
jgi:sugar/nucleoside kinase (ribokinase family)